MDYSVKKTITVNDVLHAGACYDGVMDWYKKHARGLTAMPVEAAIIYDNGWWAGLAAGVAGNSYDNAYGCGYGNGNGNGNGYGDGDGDGYGYSDGNGNGNGNGDGYGYSNGNGYGYGYGYGSFYNYGNGNGCSNGEDFL